MSNKCPKCGQPSNFYKEDILPPHGSYRSFLCGTNITNGTDTIQSPECLIAEAAYTRGLEVGKAATLPSDEWYEKFEEEYTLGEPEAYRVGMFTLWMELKRLRAQTGTTAPANCDLEPEQELTLPSDGEEWPTEDEILDFARERVNSATQSIIERRMWIKASDAIQMATDLLDWARDYKGGNS